LIARRGKDEEQDRFGQRNNFETPLKLLKRALNAPIIVKLKDGEEYKGILDNYDPTMNLVLDDSAQVDESGKAVISYGKILIRGNNILYIAVSDQNKKRAAMGSERP